MFTLGHQRKYVYPSLFFLLLFLFMLLRMAAAGAEEALPGLNPEQRDVTIKNVAAAIPAKQGNRTAPAADRSVRPHSEPDMMQAMRDFNAAINPKTERDQRLQDAILARQEDRVKNLEKSWRRTNVAVTAAPQSVQNSLKQEQTTESDYRYLAERRRIDATRNKEAELYWNRRQELLTQLAGFNKDSIEHKAVSRRLESLDMQHIARENRYAKEYQNLDTVFALRTK